MAYLHFYVTKKFLTGKLVILKLDLTKSPGPSLPHRQSSKNDIGGGPEACNTCQLTFAIMSARADYGIGGSDRTARPSNPDSFPPPGIILTLAQGKRFKLGDSNKRHTLTVVPCRPTCYLSQSTFVSDIFYFYHMPILNSFFQ